MYTSPKLNKKIIGFLLLLTEMLTDEATRTHNLHMKPMITVTPHSLCLVLSDCPSVAAQSGQQLG
jgi:hypothetical protein